MKSQQINCFRPIFIYQKITANYFNLLFLLCLPPLWKIAANYKRFVEIFKSWNFQHYFYFLIVWYFVCVCFQYFQAEIVFSFGTASTTNTTMGNPRIFPSATNVAQNRQHILFAGMNRVLRFRTCQSSFSCICVNANRQLHVYQFINNIHRIFTFLCFLEFNVNLVSILYIFVRWLSFYAKTNK